MKALLWLALAVMLYGCKGDRAPVQDGPAPDVVQDLADLQARVEAMEVALREIPEPELPKVLRAEGFVLVDRTGKIQARLGFDRMGKLDGVPGLFIYDKNGTKRLVAANTGWSVCIRLCDPRGKCHVAFTAQPQFRNEPFGVLTGYNQRALYPDKPAPDNWFSTGPPAN